MTPSTSAASARWMILITAVLFSTGGAAIKYCSLDHWQVASFRSAVAALFVLLVVRESRRFWRPRALLVGCAYAATMILFVCANKATTSANAIFLQSTAPLYVVLISPWLGERIDRRDLGFLLALAAGMSLFFFSDDAPSSTAPDPVLGNVLAALSGVGWAFTVVGLRWIGRGERAVPAASAVAAGNILACLVCLPLAIPVASLSSTDAGVIAYLGVLQIGLAYILLAKAMPHVRAFEAAVLLLLEEVLNPIFAFLVHRERPGVLALTGGAVIILTLAVRSYFESRRASLPPP